MGAKIHKKPTPLLGGVAVFASFVVATVISVPLSSPVRGVLIGSVAAVAVGVLDDVLRLPPLTHLLGQVIAATIAITFGVGVIRYVSAPSGSLVSPPIYLPWLVGMALTMFWLVGMMNAINFLDGLDGLAPGIVAIAAILLGTWASEPHSVGLPSSESYNVILPMALAGGVLGFLAYNWNPARVFLGDSGSMFLGLAIGGMAVVGPAKLGTALVVLVIPVLDVAWAIVRRAMRGKSFLSGDKRHVYHRMLELGLSPTRVVVLLYAVCAVLAVLDLQVHKLSKYIVFTVLTLALITIFAVLEFRANTRDP